MVQRSAEKRSIGFYSDCDADAPLASPHAAIVAPTSSSPLNLAAANVVLNWKLAISALFSRL